jgi:hypothetical protein
MPAKRRNKSSATDDTSQNFKSKQPPAREPWTPWGKWNKRRKEELERRRIEREQRLREKQRQAVLRRLRRRRVTLRSGVFLGLMVLACLIGFIVLLLLGRPYPWEAFRDVTGAMTLSQEAENKQQRWNELGIDHYTVEVTYISGATRCGPVMIKVENDEITGDPLRNAEQWTPREVCSMLLTEFTVDGAFQWLDAELNALRPGETYLRASFDPILGYPTSLKAGTYDLLAAGSADCCWQAEWKSLQPINNE